MTGAGTRGIYPPMSQGAPAASKRPAAGLVELKRELDALLLEYESASLAWPKEPDILTRAKIGRRVEDALRRICELQHAIATAQARGPYRTPRCSSAGSPCSLTGKVALSCAYRPPSRTKVKPCGACWRRRSRPWKPQGRRPTTGVDFH